MLTLTVFLLASWVVQFVLVKRGFLSHLNNLTAATERFGKGELSARAGLDQR